MAAMCNDCKRKLFLLREIEGIRLPSIDKRVYLCQDCVASAFVILTECCALEEMTQKLGKMYKKWGLK